MNTYKKMLITELKLSLRGMDMVIFAIVMPIIILVAIYFINGDNLAYENASYTVLQQSFGAVVSIAILASGAMGLPIVISDYRNKKILKKMKVTPIKPIMILIVQVSIYTIYSFISLVLLFAIATNFLGLRFQGNIFVFLIGWVLVLISMFSIGMLVGGVSKDQKTANVLASLLYFVMLAFSGTTIPYEIMPSLMQKISNLLPLTQGIKLLKATSLGLEVESFIVPIIIMCIIGVVCTFISIKYFKWE